MHIKIMWSCFVSCIAVWVKQVCLFDEGHGRGEEVREKPESVEEVRHVFHIVSEKFLFLIDQPLAGLNISCRGFYNHSEPCQHVPRQNLGVKDFRLKQMVENKMKELGWLNNQE